MKTINTIVIDSFQLFQKGFTLYPNSAGWIRGTINNPNYVSRETRYPSGVNIGDSRYYEGLSIHLIGMKQS